MINMTRFSLITLAVVFFQIFFVSSILAAKYDLAEEQGFNFEDSSVLDKISTPGWDTLSASSFSNQEKENKKANYLLVVDLIKQKKLELARNKITSLLKQTPDDPYLYNLRALLDLREKNKDSAEHNFQKAIKLDSNNAFAYFSLAKMALEKNHLNKAKEYADRVVVIKDKIPATYFLSAGIAYKQGDIHEAERVLLTGYKKLQGNIKGEIQIVRALSKFYVTEKQPEKILPISQDIVKRYPESNLALAILAGAQFVNNQKTLVEKTLIKIIQRDSKDTKHRISLASLLIAHPDRKNDIFKLLDEAFAINPENSQALVLKTVYLIKLKQYQQALETANKIETLFPLQPIGKQLKGETYLAEKKFDSALDAYRQSYLIKPNIKVLIVMADLLMQLDKQTDAIDLLKQELEKHTNDNTINYKLATIYQRQKDYKQAGKYFNAMLSIQPDNVLALNNLAWIYAQQNNPEAIKLSKKAYNLAPNSAAIADTFGYILVNNGQVEQGLKILQEAVKIAPQAAEIQFHLADAYSLSGYKEKAISILESLNMETKSFPEKENAQLLLKKLQTE